MTDSGRICGHRMTEAISAGGYCDLCSGVNSVEVGKVDATDIKRTQVSSSS